MQQLLERPGAVAHGVFRRRIDLAEGLLHAVGDEDRIIAEAWSPRGGKVRWPCTSPSKSLRSRHAASPATRRRRIWRTNRERLCRRNSSFDARHGDAEILGRSRPARRIDARRAVQRRRRTDRNRRPARHDRSPSAAARAFSSALAAKVAPVSSGSGRPSSPALIGSMPCGPSSALISRTLPGLWLATTSWLPRGSLTPEPSSAASTSSPMPLRASCSSCRQLLFGERRAFGGALNFHQPARAGQHEIGVGLGGGIFVIIQIEHRLALDDAAADIAAT